MTTSKPPVAQGAGGIQNAYSRHNHLVFVPIIWPVCHSSEHHDTRCILFARIMSPPYVAILAQVSELHPDCLLVRFGLRQACNMDGGRSNLKPAKFPRRDRIANSEMTLDECKSALEVWFTHQSSRRLDDLLTMPLREWDWKSQPAPQQMCDNRLVSLVKSFLPKCKNLTPRLLTVRDALFHLHMDKPCLSGISPWHFARPMASCIRMVLFRYSGIEN